jgi:hypothetical protein
MHSSQYMYTDPYPRLGQPGAGGPEQFNFNHNGDFSGDVLLDIEGWRVDLVHTSDSPYARHGEAIYQVKIPFEVLAELVAEAVLRNKIANLENDDYKKILGLL